MFLSPNQVGFEVVEAFAELSGILIKTTTFWYNFNSNALCFDLFNFVYSRLMSCLIYKVFV